MDPSLGKRLTMFDPMLVMSAPKELARDAALNAFVFAVQGLEAATREPLADALLLHAVRLLAASLCQLENEPESPVVRGDLMMGALLAGQGTDYTQEGLAAVVGHCVGARHHLPNGLTNSILLPHTLASNAQATGNRLAVACEIMGEKPRDPPALAMARLCVAFFRDLRLPGRLRDLHVSRDHFGQIVQDASTDWFFYQNPRRVNDPDELLAVLEGAW